ncbi:MAG: hypothetical protein R3D31_16460 [Hyphomicrobiaceae bacterium]
MATEVPLDELDPGVAFGTPERLVSRSDLTREQKIELLRRWWYDAAEEAVALEEGMPGEESSLLRRIILALEGLAGPVDVSHAGPSKHHGIPRAALKRRA